ncbi:MAG TPA: DUF559 domain-containing protein [Allosphingosinicella sp.]|nr:DUF559 domain-containing protein [Allosphingosinicella sp.]
MILPGTGRGTARKASGGGGSVSLRRPEVYAARKLRRDMSFPEVLLWQRLRGGKSGLKIRRQHPIGPYVADFYCSAGRIVIEIDGEAHGRGDQPARDVERDQYLEANGYRVMRISATEVLRDPGEAAASIAALVTSPLHHRAARGGPPPHAGEDSNA